MLHKYSAMKRLAIIILCISVLGACRYKTGSGNIIAEKRNTGAFTAIAVGGGFEVELRHSDITEVTVEADDNLIKYIKTIVVDGQLKIKLDNINVHDAHLKVFLAAPEINDINASAAATVEVRDELKSGGSIRLHASSGAEIKTVLDAPEIVANASSGGELNLSGRTRDFKASVSSGSTIKAKELQSENTDITASSGASASVHASLQLNAKASSGANITYRGAASVRKTVSSGGEVEKNE